MKDYFLIFVIFLSLLIPVLNSEATNPPYITQGSINPVGNENVFANFTASLFNIHFESLFKFSAHCQVSFTSFSANVLKLNISSIFFALYNNTIGSPKLFLLDTFSVYPDQLFIPGQILQFNVSFDGSITQPTLSKGYFLYLSFNKAFLLSNQSIWFSVSSYNNLFIIPTSSISSFISSKTAENAGLGLFAIILALVFLPFFKRKIKIS